MPTSPTFVIVGAGLAGVKAAETLRGEGFTGRLLLVGEEAERPYDRPPLSKAYLRGEADRDSLYLHEDGFYAAHDIELHRSAPVRSIHPAARELELASGERIGYDRLLLATGAAPRRLPLPGAELDGIHHLRSRRDADTLAAAAARAEQIVVVGTGWIGSEAAASLRQLGREVTLLGPDTAPLARVLGPEVAGVYRDLHADHGVRLVLGTRVAGFRGTGRVEAVVTGDGRTIPCDLVLVGAGAAPRTELAQAAGLPVRDGVLVNERLPYFYSDQYDLGMQHAGLATAWDQVVLRGDPATHAFIAFWLKDRQVVAGMHANIWDAIEPIQTLIHDRRPVDPDRLADPTIPLDQVAGQRSAALTARSIR